MSQVPAEIVKFWIGHAKIDLTEKYSRLSENLALTPGLVGEGGTTMSTKSLQPGTVIFATFAILSAIVCVVKGLVPIYAIEAFVWATLASFWHVEQIKNKVANYIMLSLTLAVLLGNAFSIGRAAGYKAGYTGGIAKGHTTGYKEGNKAGYFEGKEAGAQNYLLEVGICDDPDVFRDNQAFKQASCARVSAEKAKFAAKLVQNKADFLATISK
jgi:hypothetical protein